MAEGRLSFEKRKFVLKCYWKCENTVEVQRQFRMEFGTDPPTWLTKTRIRDKFEADGTVPDMHKGHSGRPRSSTSPTKQENLLERLQQFQENLFGKRPERQESPNQAPIVS